MSWASLIISSSMFDLASATLYMLASLSAVIPLVHHWYHDIKRHALDMTRAEYKAYRKKQKKARKAKRRA